MKERKEVEFNKIVEALMDRRTFMKKSVLFGTSLFVTSADATSALLKDKSSTASMQFKPVKSNSLDTITLPEGFTWQRVMSWGDPLFAKGEAFDPKTRGTVLTQALAFGDNNDGMDLFVTKEGHTILAVNNEYINPSIFHGNRVSRAAENLDDVKKEQLAVGVSMVEVTEKNNQWHIVEDSTYNRKITALTEIDIVGPARGDTLLKTSYDPKGVSATGTWANCGNGKTPWGTYLTCEENFNYQFTCSDAGKISKALKRYGIRDKSTPYTWGEFDKRFDVAKEPNEPNRVGYVVEIDPLNPNAKPRKLTALGRLKHENAEVVLAEDGHVVVYMGDDERGEYLYKFISKRKYTEGVERATLLEDGMLYAAKFHDDGTGEWIALTPESTGMSKAEICIHTRVAASKVNATTMDRPEWVAAHPMKNEVYCSLTNNKNRGVKPNTGGDETPVGAVNPRRINHYGQIVKWIPKDSDHTSSQFEWNLFVLAGNPKKQQGIYRGSSNITANNMFNSPDGLKFDSNGGLWIQTDGNYSNSGDFEGMGNNQMLLANTKTGEIKRFLVGPKECEITGLTWSPDKKTMFVGIQHPGEKGNSHFPEGKDHIPRSSIIAVKREDGGRIEI